MWLRRGLARPGRTILRGLCLLAVMVLTKGANGREPADVSLSQASLAQPDEVVAWLKKNARAADQTSAQRYLAMGQDAQKKGNWSRAAKAFGESALLFPSAAALKGYADSLLQALGALRRSQEPAAADLARVHADLSLLLSLYRSALAAQAVVSSLSRAEVARLQSDERCLKSYLTPIKGQSTGATDAGSGTLAPDSTCRPLRLYLNLG